LPPPGVNCNRRKHRTEVSWNRSSPVLSRRASASKVKRRSPSAAASVLDANDSRTFPPRASARCHPLVTHRGRVSGRPVLARSQFAVGRRRDNLRWPPLATRNSPFFRIEADCRRRSDAAVVVVPARTHDSLAPTAPPVFPAVFRSPAILRASPSQPPPTPNHGGSVCCRVKLKLRRCRRQTRCPPSRFRACPRVTCWSCLRLLRQLPPCALYTSPSCFCCDVSDVSIITLLTSSCSCIIVVGSCDCVHLVFLVADCIW